ncbi:hypothetical protein BKA62DRAFT_801193, partial [Auriculariales sp. MPI-PUGE-AT-0066]
PSCVGVGNEIRTCWPLANTVVQQNTFSKVIWNVGHPYFAQFGAIDIYLRSADSGNPVLSWKNVPTARGQIETCADDEWLGEAGKVFAGNNITWTFQYVIVQTGTVITGAEQAETTFSVLQNQPENSVLAASHSAAASVSASASLASISSISSGNSASQGSQTGGNGNHDLQNEGNKDNFPSWAIALLVVLGVFALIGALFVSFFMCREYRRRQSRNSSLRRESLGSEAPMMAAIGTNTAPTSPTQGPRAVASYPRSYRGHAADASSTTSHTHSAIGETTPFTVTDAAFVADAFRNAMRKPDFKDRPLEEGESPDALPETSKPAPDAVLSRELAEEGRDIRSVHSVRGVKVESLLDHDHDRD